MSIDFNIVIKQRLKLKVEGFLLLESKKAEKKERIASK
jgi:hypothetical protein